MSYAIKVIWKDGEEELVMSGFGKAARVAVFPSKARAQEHADFLEMGIDDAQSINVVRAPRPAVIQKWNEEGPFRVSTPTEATHGE